MNQLRYRSVLHILLLVCMVQSVHAAYSIGIHVGLQLLRDHPYFTGTSTVIAAGTVGYVLWRRKHNKAVVDLRSQTSTPSPSQYDVASRPAVTTGFLTATELIPNYTIKTLLAKGLKCTWSASIRSEHPNCMLYAIEVGDTSLESYYLLSENWSDPHCQMNKDYEAFYLSSRTPSIRLKLDYPIRMHCLLGEKCAREDCNALQKVFVSNLLYRRQANAELQPLYFFSPCIHPQRLQRLTPEEAHDDLEARKRELQA